MQLPSIYRETRLESAREFRLLEDRIQIRGKTDSADYELNIDLRTIEPHPDRIATQSKYHQWGFVFALGCLGGLFFMTDQEPTSRGPMTLFILTGLLLVFVICTWRKVEFACFKHLSGVAAFDIARAGRDAKKFDAFVQGVVEQIRIARGMP
jgi:hypothetical protein